MSSLTVSTRRDTLSMSAQPLSDLVLFVLDNSAFMINEDFQEGTRFKAVSHAVQLLATSFVNRSRRTETRVGFSAIVGAGETPRTIVVASESKIPLCAAVEEQASSCSGEFQLAWSLRLAMLNLKRVPASTCRRVIVLVGSPVTDSDEELLNSATYFRKHNIRVDLIQFTRSSSTPKKRSSTSKPIPLSKTTRKLNLLMNALSESSQRVVVPAGSAQISFKLVDLLMEISEIAPHRSPSWTRWLASSAGKSRLVDSRPSASTRRRPSDRVPIPASPMKMPTLPPVAPMDSCRMDSRFKHSSFEYVCVDIELPTNDVTEGALPRLRTRILEPPSKQYPPRVLFEFRAGRLRVENRKVTPLSRRGRLSLVRFQTDNSLHLQWSDRQRRGVYLDVEIPEASVQLEWVNAGKSTDRIFRVRFLTPSLFECVAASGRIPFRVRPCDRSDELDDSVWEYLLPPPSTVSKSSSPASDPFLNIGVSPEEERQLELEEEGLYTFRPRTQSPIPAAAAEPTACAPTDVAPSAAHSPSAHVSATDRPTSSVTAPRQRPVRLPALLFWVQEPQEEHESVEQILDQINELLRQANQLRQRSAAQRPRLAVLSGGSLGLTPDQLINLFMLSNGQSKSGRPSVAAAAAVVAALDVPANGAGASTLTKKSTRSTRARNPTRSARRSLRAAAAALPPIPPLGQSVRRASPRLGAESGRSARSGASSPSSSATSRGPHTHGGRASSSAEHTYALSPMPSRAHAVAAKTSSTRRAAPRRALPALSSSRLHPQHHRRRQRALGTSSASSTPLSYENGQRPLHSSSSSSSSSSSVRYWEARIPAVGLPAGEHLYRFNVDGVWMCCEDLPQREDEYGVLHNVLVVAFSDPQQSNISTASPAVLPPAASVSSRKGKEPADEHNVDFLTTVGHANTEQAQALVTEKAHKLKELCAAVSETKVGSYFLDDAWLNTLLSQSGDEVEVALQVVRVAAQLARLRPEASLQLVERYASRVYAGLEASLDSAIASMDAVSALLDMGFPMLKCCRAVEHTDRDLVKAIDLLSLDAPVLQKDTLSPLRVAAERRRALADLSEVCECPELCMLALDHTQKHRETREAAVEADYGGGDVDAPRADGYDLEAARAWLVARDARLVPPDTGRERLEIALQLLEFGLYLPAVLLALRKTGDDGDRAATLCFEDDEALRSEVVEVFENAMQEKRRRQQVVEAERRALQLEAQQAKGEQQVDKVHRSADPLDTGPADGLLRSLVDPDASSASGALSPACASLLRTLRQHEKEKLTFLCDMISLVQLLSQSKAGTHYLASPAVTQTLLMFLSVMHSTLLRQPAVEILTRTLACAQPQALPIAMELFSLQLGHKKVIIGSTTIEGAIDQLLLLVSNSLHMSARYASPSGKMITTPIRFGTQQKLIQVALESTTLAKAITGFFASLAELPLWKLPIESAYGRALDELHQLAVDPHFRLSAGDETEQDTAADEDDSDDLPTEVLVSLAVLASLGDSVHRERYIRGLCAQRPWLQISITDGQLRANISISPHVNNRAELKSNHLFVRMIVVLDTSTNKIQFECRSLPTEGVEHCRYCQVTLPFGRDRTAADLPASASTSVAVSSPNVSDSSAPSSRTTSGSSSIPCCESRECTEKLKFSCKRTHPCGHACAGIDGEEECLPCLQQPCVKNSVVKQEADDYCSVCFTESIGSAPSIRLGCGHIFHFQCIQMYMRRKWNGPRITFGFGRCPLCKEDIKHDALREEITEFMHLFEDVKEKALMRLRYEGLDKCEEITQEGSLFYDDPAGFAMDRYAYYSCFKCEKPYFGGNRQCDEGAQVNFNKSELVCASCSGSVQECKKHGTEYLEWKCQFCCSVAIFFCFGRVHFCESCHRHPTQIQKEKEKWPDCEGGPECPLHLMQHPPAGTEHPLGCGLCRNVKSF